MPENESMDIYRALFEHSLDALFVTTPEGSILAANPAACALLGRSEAEICRLGRAGIVDLSSPQLRRLLDERMANGSAQGELFFIRADCSRVEVEVTSACFSDPQGRMLTALIARDLSPFLETRGLIAASEAKFHSVVQAMAEGVVFQDAEGRIVETNRAALEIQGRSNDEMLGRDSDDPVWGAVREDGSFFPGDQHPAIVTLRTGEPQSDVVMGIRRPSGEQRWISINAQPVVGPDGNTRIGVVTTFHDVTERKHQEQQIAEYIAKLEKSMEQTLHAVANMVELRDPYTAGHVQRVATIAGAIAREMGWPEGRCNNLKLIALVHNVGMIAIPAQILVKPSSLTPLEYELIKGHPEWGYEILKDVDFPLPIANIIRQHHERLDGSGYPHGLRGDEILPEARVIAVADVVAAMTAHRPYRPALNLDEAIAEICGHRSEWFDPEVVDALLYLVGKQGYQLPA